MMNSSLENALKEIWEMKEKFYEDTIGLTMIEILEKIEGKEFKVKLVSVTPCRPGKKTPKYGNAGEIEDEK